MKLDDWISLSETARRLNRSVRSLQPDRLGEKDPERRLRRRPGRKSEPVFNPRDVERLEAETPFVVPPPGAPGEAVMPAAPRAVDSLATALFAAIANAGAGPLLLSLKEAAAFVGLPQTALLAIAKAGGLTVVRCPAYRFYRSELVNLANPSNVETLEKSGRILRGIAPPRPRAITAGA